jgi:hypothetical protein
MARVLRAAKTSLTQAAAGGAITAPPALKQSMGLREDPASEHRAGTRIDPQSPWNFSPRSGRSILKGRATRRGLFYARNESGIQGLFTCPRGCSSQGYRSLRGNEGRSPGALRVCRSCRRPAVCHQGLPRWRHAGCLQLPAARYAARHVQRHRAPAVRQRRAHSPRWRGCRLLGDAGIAARTARHRVLAARRAIQLRFAGVCPSTWRARISLAWSSPFGNLYRRRFFVASKLRPVSVNLARCETFFFTRSKASRSSARTILRPRAWSIGPSEIRPSPFTGTGASSFAA